MPAVIDLEFFADVGPRPSPQHSIDRIDSNDHYRVGNCRWATPKEQTHNRRPRTETQTAEVGT
jgi:hypothetical protein